MHKRLQSGSSGPFAENAWTARYFGTGPTWRRSWSISNISITSIAYTPDPRTPTSVGRQRRWLTSKSQLLSMAEAWSRLIPNADCRVILVIRHRHHSARHRYRQATTAVQPSPRRSGNQPARVGEVQRHRCRTGTVLRMNESCLLSPNR